MADILRAKYATGNILYLVARYSSTSYVLLCDGTQVDYNPLNLSAYAVYLTESVGSTGLYYTTVNSIWPNGIIDIQFFVQYGTTPDVLDPLLATVSIVKSPSNISFDIVRGDDYLNGSSQDNRVYLNVVNGPNLTASSNLMSIYNSDEEVIFSKTVDVISDNTLAVNLTSIETNSISSGGYSVEVVATLADTTVRTLWNGTVNVLDQSEINTGNLPNINVIPSGNVTTTGYFNFTVGDDVIIHIHIINGPNLSGGTGTIYFYDMVTGDVAYSYPMGVVDNTDVTLSLTSMQTTLICASAYRASIKFILADTTVRTIWGGTVDVTTV